MFIKPVIVQEHGPRDRTESSRKGLTAASLQDQWIIISFSSVDMTVVSTTKQVASTLD